MKVLLVRLSPIESRDSANIRTLGLVKGLLESNCIIDYLTIPPSNSHTTMPDKEFMKDINVIKTQSNELYHSVISNSRGIKKKLVGFMRKVYHSFNLYDYTYSIANSINIDILNKVGYDLVISSSDPKTSHIVVKHLIKQGLIYKKWIQYWGDPMALDITRKSLYPNWFVSNIEKKILSSADSIVYVSPFTLKQQTMLFPELSNKMHFIPIPYIDEKIYDETQNDIYTVGYFGAYESTVRDIIPLYNAGIEMKNMININIIGDTDLDLTETENIKLHPRGDISEFESRADLLVCILNKKGAQIPGKIYHSAATNKPILVVLDGEEVEEMKRYLDGFSRFILCENNKESIIAAIENIISENKKYKPARQFVSKEIALNFLDLI